MSRSEMQQFGVSIGQDYPAPIPASQLVRPHGGNLPAVLCCAVLCCALLGYALLHWPHSCAVLFLNRHLTILYSLQQSYAVRMMRVLHQLCSPAAGKMRENCDRLHYDTMGPT